MTQSSFPRTESIHLETNPILFDFVSGLEGSLAEEKQALVAAEENASSLKQEIEAAGITAQTTKKNADELREEQEKLLAALSALQKEEKALHAQLNSDLDSVAEITAKRKEELRGQVEAVQSRLRKLHAAREKSAATVEEAYASFVEKRDIASIILAEQEARHRILREEYENISQQLTESISATITRNSVAIVEAEAARKANELARLSLQEAKDQLAKTEQEIKENQALCDSHQAAFDKEITTIRESHRQALENAQNAEQKTRNELEEKRSAVQKADQFFQLTQRSYLKTEERVGSLMKKIKEVCTEAEKISTEMSGKMEDALLYVKAHRDEHLETLRFFQEKETALLQADAVEKEKNDALYILRGEKQDLHNTLLVAEELAQNATTARMSATLEMRPTLIAMEDALLASAEEAKLQEVEKEAELRKGEEAYLRAVEETQQKRLALTDAKNALNKKEADCVAAEQAVQKLDALLGQHSEKKTNYNEAVQTLRAAHEKAYQEMLSLKEANDAAGNQLRIAKNETEKIERNLTDIVNNKRQLLSASNTELLITEEKWRAQISEAVALLDIAKDKYERLLVAYNQKETAYQGIQETLEQKDQIAAAVQEELTRRQESANEALSQHKAALDQTISEDENRHLIACTEANEASAFYDNALLASIQAADEIAQAQNELLTIEAEEKIFFERSAKEQEEATQAAKNAQDQLAQKRVILEDTLRNLNNRLDLLRIEAEEVGKKPSQLIAALEAEKIRIEQHKVRIEELEAEETAMIDAERKRLEEEEAAAALALQEEEEARRQRKAEEERQKAQEAARLEAKKEQARLQAEAEAAKIAAGEVLKQEDNLALIQSGEIEDRMARVAAMAKKGVQKLDLRWIEAEEAEKIRKEATDLSDAAGEEKQLFLAAQKTLHNLNGRLQQCESEREALQQTVIEQTALQAKTEEEHSALRTVEAVLATSLENAGENSSKLLSLSGKHIQKAMQNCVQSLENCQKEIAIANEELLQADQAMEEAKKEYEDAATILNEIVVNWIYSETKAIKARAKAEKLSAEQEARSQVQQEAEKRFQTARNAGNDHSAKRIGSVSKAAPGKKLKRK